MTLTDNIARMTRRANRAQEEFLLKRDYVLAGHKPPKKILWFDSPQAASKAARYYDTLKHSSIKRHRVYPRTPVLLYTRRGLKSYAYNQTLRLKSKSNACSSTSSGLLSYFQWLDRSHDVGAGYGDLFRDSKTISRTHTLESYTVEFYGGRSELIRKSRNRDGTATIVTETVDCDYLDFNTPELVPYHYAVCFSKIAFMSERPVQIKLDQEGQLHSLDDLAFMYADGFGLAYISGRKVPAKWLGDGFPTPAQAVTYPNMDDRMWLCEYIGWDKILNEVECEVIEDSGDPTWGKLVSANLFNRFSLRSSLRGNEYDQPVLNSPREKFLIAQCGTGRQVVLPVPDEVNTVDEAQSALHGDIPVEILKNCVRRT